MLDEERDSSGDIEQRSQSELHASGKGNAGELHQEDLNSATIQTAPAMR